MEVGISTATLFLRKNNEEALPLFDTWKIPCAEVFLTSFCEYAPDFSRALNKLKGGVKIHSVHVLNTQYEPQLYAEHPRVREDAYAWLGQVLASANVLGAKNYTFHGLARLKRTFRENRQRFCSQTAKIYETCLEQKVRLCYENVEWALYNRPGVFTELKRGCPGLGAVLDVKQARISGYDWRDYLDEMGDSLVTVHVSDVDEDGKMCLPGRGTFEYRELFSRLSDAGFDGAVLIENYSGDYGEIDEIRRSYEFLAELIENYR